MNFIKQNLSMFDRVYKSIKYFSEHTIPNSVNSKTTSWSNHFKVKKQKVLDEIPNDSLVQYLLDTEYNYSNSTEPYFKIYDSEKKEIINFLKTIDIKQDPIIVKQRLLNFLDNLKSKRIFQYQLSATIYEVVKDE